MRALSIALLISSLSPVLSAQSADVPLHNWTVPAYPRSSGGGITTMTDVTPPRTFVGVQPCRVADTRGNGAPIQGGIFSNGQARNWTVWNICGIPSGADAISVNFSVVSPAATPLGAFLLAWPTGQPPPPTAIMTYGPGATVISNAAIVPLSGSGQLTVNVSHSTHIVMDVNGYFSALLGNPANFLELDNSSNFYTFFARNFAPGCPGACGIFMQTESTVGNAAIVGSAAGATGLNFGVEGVIASTTAGSAGVHGISPATTGKRYGVLGEIDGSKNAISNSAGVLGRDTLAPVAQNFNTLPAGVRGESTFSLGVLGVSAGGIAVEGILNTLLGDYQSEGRLGSGDYGLYAFGDVGATGTKFFVEPHPTDASKVIRYVALEGGESGTYFRGRGRFVNGVATIEVPEDFRMVTDAEGLTVQVTPIGGIASVGVVRMDLDEIVVQSTRDLEFSFLVNGVRRSQKDRIGPIVENTFEYVPRSAEEKMPGYLSQDQKQVLIGNGTYRPDGTVNLETARRLGWDRIWAQRERPSRRLASE